MTKEKRPNPDQGNESLNYNNSGGENLQGFPFKSLDEKLAKTIKTLKETPENHHNSIIAWFSNCLSTLKEFKFQKEYKEYFEKKRVEIIRLGIEKGIEEKWIVDTLGNTLNSSAYSKLIKSLEGLFDGNLKWDVMLNKLRWRNKPIALTNFQALMERLMDTKLNTDEFKRITSYYSQQHEYNAIQTYLIGLQQVNEPEVVLEQFYVLLRVSEPMHRIYIRKWLISAVARSLNPGCKADHVLILKSPQGFKKTSFFNALAGDLFQTYSNSGNDKDDLMGLYRSWICEFGEVSYTFSKQGNDKLKEFITRKHDCFVVHIPQMLKNTLDTLYLLLL